MPKILSLVTFDPESDFYRGHFPGDPITPGVLLLESMAQVSVVALGIYLASRTRSAEEIRNVLSVFSDAQVDFTGIVRPDERVLITGELVFQRRGKIRSKVSMCREDGTEVCSGVVSGMEVAR